MSHITNIMRKEIREMLSPGSVASILIMVVLFAGLGGLIGGEVEKSTALPEIAIVADDGTYYEYTYIDEQGETRTVVWNPIGSLTNYYGEDVDKIHVLESSTTASDDTIVDEMMDRGIANALVFPDIETFRQSMAESRSVSIQQLYIYEPTGMFGTVGSAIMSTVISLLNEDLSRILISEKGGEDYEFLTNPLTSSGDSIVTVVDGKLQTGITPGDISSMVSSQTMMIPIVIMIIIMMVGSIVISSMGSEKENKTLETLLTLPIRRTSIVAGKIVAAAVVGLIYGLAYMVGMSIYMGSMTGMLSSATGDVNLEALGMSLDMTDWALVMVSMFLSIVCALGICMILGAFSKNYKSAQTMTMPLSILAMIPMFVIMFTGWYGTGAVIQGVCFAIPFSHPMMAMQALMYGDVTLVLAGIAYMAVFAIVTVLITVKLYNSDVLITGLGQNKWVQMITRRNRSYEQRSEDNSRSTVRRQDQSDPCPRERGHGCPRVRIRHSEMLPRMRHIRTRRVGPRVQDGGRQDGDRRTRRYWRGIRHARGRGHVVPGTASPVRDTDRGRGHRPPQGHRQMGWRPPVPL